MPKVTLAPLQQAEDTAHPILGGGLGTYAFQLLSDPGGLTQLHLSRCCHPVPALASGIGTRPKTRWSMCWRARWC